MTPGVMQVGFVVITPSSHSCSGTVISVSVFSSSLRFSFLPGSSDVSPHATSPVTSDAKHIANRMGNSLFLIVFLLSIIYAVIKI